MSLCARGDTAETIQAETATPQLGFVPKGMLLPMAEDLANGSRELAERNEAQVSALSTTVLHTGRKPSFEGEYMDPIGVIGGGVVLLVGALLEVKYFPDEVAEFWRRLGAPSASTVKKQSHEMLANMDRNVAGRKSWQGR
jgi:hypothetical protein